jgi:hypothetical protein
MGSGAGDATKPSNSLIREIVAALTLGPVHARGSTGDAIVPAKSAESDNVKVEKCILEVGIVRVEYCILGLWNERCRYIHDFHYSSASPNPVLDHLTLPSQNRR